MPNLLVIPFHVLETARWLPVAAGESRFTLEQIASHLGVTRMTVHRWRREGFIPGGYSRPLLHLVESWARESRLEAEQSRGDVPATSPLALLSPQELEAAARSEHKFPPAKARR